jgi:hypothetical protein
MNGWTLKKWIMQPISAPPAQPVTSTTSAASGTGRWARITSSAKSIPLNPMTEPIDRSMPPARMTNVAPTAAITRYPLLTRRFGPTWASNEYR